MSCLILSVKHVVYRTHLVWAAARLMDMFMSPDHDPKLCKGKPSKKRILSELRWQLDLFGSDEESLMSPNWRDDYARTIPAAEELVSKLWPDIKD